jgi:ribosomal protein S14
MKRSKSTATDKPVNRGRHETNCKVCQHPERAAIEDEFIAWKSPSRITKDWGFRDRTTLYRHAWATGLIEKRRRNVRAALESIIERSQDVEVTAAAVVQAVAAYARINSEGRLVERNERVNLNQLFERMTRDELREYAESGKLPHWFEETVGRSALRTTAQERSEEEVGDGL